jgi:UrcA family protein
MRNIGLAALVAFTAAGSARADDYTATRVVTTHGLDLTSASDRARLRLQIIKAARAVCAQTNEGLGPSDPAFDSCFEIAYSDAWAQVRVKIAAAKNRAMFASGAAK